MKNHRNKQLNDDICKDHINNQEKYECYCINCKKHLCKECLKARTHLNHNKNNIIEIQPIQEELNIMMEIINHYKDREEKLIKENMIFNQKLEKSLNDQKFQLNKKFEEKTQINANNKDKEIKLNNEKFITEIEEIKRRYEEEIRIKKIEYEKKNNKINNDYKEKNEKNKIILKTQINELHQKHDEEIERKGYDKKIKNLKSIVEFNEIVYFTYKSYRQNYYNCINLNNLLINYYKDENIKNNVIKKILKDDYDKVTKLILERKDTENEKEDHKDKEKEKIKILEAENQKLKDELEKLKKKLEENRGISQETNQEINQEANQETNQETEQNMMNENEHNQELDQTTSTTSTSITASSSIQNND